MLGLGLVAFFAFCGLALALACRWDRASVLWAIGACAAFGAVVAFVPIPAG